MKRVAFVILPSILVMLTAQTCLCQSGSCHCPEQSKTIVACSGSGGCNDYIDIYSPSGTGNCIGFEWIQVSCCGREYASYSGVPYACLVTGPAGAASRRDALIPRDALDFGAVAGCSGGAPGKGQTASAITR